MKNVLISVYDTSNIVDFSKSLLQLGYNLIVSNSTAKILSEHQLPYTLISSYTGIPELFQGRLKTIHTKIFGGILMRNLSDDLKQAADHNISPIEIVCVNFYPFKKISEDANSDLNIIIENIDIGGPALIRAAAKNYKYVSVLTSPDQYQDFINVLKSNTLDENYRMKLAYKAFLYSTEYDISIAKFFEKKIELKNINLQISSKFTKILRYGENPHQKAVLYGDFFSYFDFLHGKEISYNNILDLISGVELAEELNSAAVVIIKHNNPCGVASLDNPYNSYVQALKCDPVSAFGGVVIFSEEIDEKLANKLNEHFWELIVATEYTPKALEILKKKTERRILRKKNNINSITEPNIRSIPGGFLVQEKNNLILNLSTLKFITENKPSARELEDMIFALTVVKHTKSNAIVIAKNKTVLGIGAGQTSRLDAVKIAISKAKEFGFDLTNSVAASDAFFPFADSVIKLAQAGVNAIIQPGGSVRDEEVNLAAEKYNISMIHTGIRHFKH